MSQDGLSNHSHSASARHAHLPHAIYTATQVRELDRLAIEERGIAGYVLMCRAAGAAFTALRERWPQARNIVVVCGGGNNGGDGYVIARLAHQAGLHSCMLMLADLTALKGDALKAFREARKAGVAVQSFSNEALAGADVLVDAIFGTGLQRDVSEQWYRAIEAINRQTVPVLAIDIPSGLHADRGEILGIAVRADLTVSFIGLKQGMFSGEGPACCGEILFDDLDIPADLYGSVTASCHLYDGSDLPVLLPPRPRTAHKGDHGHVLVIGGDNGMAGAARMAAEAAARCGAGLVSVATRSTHAGIQAALRPELMFRSVETVEELTPLLERATVIAAGPGLGTGGWGRKLLEAAMERDLPLVLDADALNLLPGLSKKRNNWILTPHPGEAARLLGITTAEVQQDRFRAVHELIDEYHGVAILKGAGTLIAASDAPTCICTAGNPGMASGGMGDVLTGVIAGLLAQGLRRYDAARAGVYLHARAGDLAAANGERGLLATDLFPYLRSLVNPCS